MIKVKLKFRLHETLITDEAAQMVILYKEPGSIFYKKLTHFISSFSYGWDHPRSGYKNPDYFNEVQNFMSNTQKIKEIAKDMILKDIAKNKNAEILDTNAKDVRKLLKGKTIKFEFEGDKE